MPATFNHKPEPPNPICNKCICYPSSNCWRVIQKDAVCASFTLRMDSGESDDTEKRKPPLGCAPYYVHVSSRICELCEAIKRYSTEKGKHDKIKLWAQEILMLNELDRNMAYVSKQKVFFGDDKEV